MVNADDFIANHMKDGVDEDELDIDEKSAVMQDQLKNETKGDKKRSEKYKDETPQEDDN